MNIVEVIEADAQLVAQIRALQQKRMEIRRECTHKHPDGTDATVGVPVSTERWCQTCGAAFD